MDRKCFKSCFQKKIWLLTILLLLKDLNTICFQSMNLYVLIFSFLPQNQQRICMYWFVIHFLPCLNKNCSHAIKVKDKWFEPYPLHEFPLEMFLPKKLKNIVFFPPFLFSYNLLEWLMPLKFLQLQQVMDSFIIFASQEMETNILHVNHKHTLSNFSSRPSLPNMPWTQFSPSKIRIAPFPTREYVDDEFQSIVKKVMGVL